MKCRTKHSYFENLNPSLIHQPVFFHEIWKSTFISAGGHGDNPEKALEVADENDNLLAFGRIFIANPDLPHRLQENFPLNLFNRAIFYTQGAEGYINYPKWEESRNAGMDEMPKVAL
jgi:2,4-dienoyl-CoA reductase-like NADH-dependent reductase (Old Yellow Enzyme family)